MKEKIVALDIGGVCVSLNWMESIRQFGLGGPGEIPKDFAALDLLLETGKITEEEWFRKITAMTKGKMSRAEILDAWNILIGPDIPGMGNAVRKLIPLGYRFVYFSNTSRLHLDEVARKNKFGHLVTGGVYSYSAGRMKPDPEIYRIFEQKYGVPFAYFDDRTENVEGGKAAGWNSILYTSPDDFFRYLSDGSRSSL